MKKFLFITGVLFLASCTNSEKVDGVYHGDLTHNGNEPIGATVSLNKNGNNFVYLTVNSSFGNFVNTDIKIEPENGFYEMRIETAVTINYPNEIISLVGYCDPEQSQKLHFSYTIDLDGIPGGVTADGTFDGNKFP